MSRGPFLCIDCGNKVVIRRPHLWDESKQGHRCQDCWDVLIETQ